MDVGAALTAIGVVVSLLVFVVTAVWAVAQIKETTSNLALEIKHLATKITELSTAREDHEDRLRQLEFRSHSK